MSATVISEFTSALERGDELLTRKKFEEKIALLEEFNRLLVESVGDCILIIDGNGRVLSINAAGRELLQLAPNEMVLHRQWTTLFPGLDHKAATAKLPPAKTRLVIQATSRNPSGESKFWNLTFTSFGGVNAGDRFMLIARDTTEHMLAEKALRRS